MGRYATETGGGRDFKQAPAGNHIARCIQIIDIGSQEKEWQGKKYLAPQIIIRWELPFETDEFDGETKPLIVSRYYTNSLSEKANLRADLESWRGRQFTVEELMKFDMEKILGQPCTVSIVHTDKGKAKVVGVAGVPKGSTCPPPFNTVSSFWLNPEDFDYAKFEALPAGFKKQVELSPEWAAVMGPEQGAKHDPAAEKKKSPDDFEDDIPF